jgi:hypothetical protein
VCGFGSAAITRKDREQSKAALIAAVMTRILPPRAGCSQVEDLLFRRLCYVGLTVILGDQLHLVLDAQFQLFQAHLFHFFVFAQISFSGKRVKALRVLGVFLSQPPKFIVAGKKLFTNGIYHPEEPPALF